MIHHVGIDPEANEDPQLTSSTFCVTSSTRIEGFEGFKGLWPMFGSSMPFATVSRKIYHIMIENWLTGLSAAHDTDLEFKNSHMILMILFSSHLSPRITRFGTKTHLSAVKIHNNFGLDWLWSSLSFSVLKPIFLPNLFALFCIIFSETRRS